MTALEMVRIIAHISFVMDEVFVRWCEKNRREVGVIVVL